MVFVSARFALPRKVFIVDMVMLESIPEIATTHINSTSEKPRWQYCFESFIFNS
jgi:hypothetical protein